MPDTRWTLADVQRHLTARGRPLAPGSMALDARTFPAPGCTVDNAALLVPLPPPLSLMLPFPPGVNSWLVPVDSRQVKSPAHRQYVHDVGWAAKQQYHGALLMGSLAMTVAYHPPDHRAYDIDRGCKAVLDGLEQIVYGNDKQVKWLLLTMEDVAQPGYVHVTIQERSAP